MARLVKTVVTSNLYCDVVTTYEDGSTKKRQLKNDDILETPLRYVNNSKEIVDVIGRVKSIGAYAKKATSSIDLVNPVTNFYKYVSLATLSMDVSEQYQSKILIIDPKEIIEDEGEENVVKVDAVPAPEVHLELTYSDRSVVEQSLEIGDVIEYCKIMNTPGKPDIEGSFKVVDFLYANTGATKMVYNGMVLKPIEATVTKAIKVDFKKIISFEEIPAVEVTTPDSLSILNVALQTEDKVFATLGTDVTIPKRDDGRISTVMIGEGKTLEVDLNGHDINCQAYAFYVNGGTLNISDSTGKGKIKPVMMNVAYPAIQVLASGVCNMDGGIIDTTAVPEEGTSDYNWLYGVVCFGDGVFNMTGGQLITSGASGICITNGTASGEGAQFNISGDSKIIATECAAIYLADNKAVNLTDNAVIEGGIVARMGDINIGGNVTVKSPATAEFVDDLGNQVCVSGVTAPKAAILALTGVYGSTLGNDMNINIAATAKVKGLIDDAIDIATVNTKYDQVVNINIEDLDSITCKSDFHKYRIYKHDELAEMATAVGRTLGAETNTTDLTIKVGEEIVYPVVDETTESEG